MNGPFSSCPPFHSLSDFFAKNNFRTGTESFTSKSNNSKLSSFKDPYIKVFESRINGADSICALLIDSFKCLTTALYFPFDSSIAVSQPIISAFANFFNCFIFSISELFLLVVNFVYSAFAAS